MIDQGARFLIGKHAVLEPTEEMRTEAQAVLDIHCESPVTGRCKECGAFGPCEQREAAIRVMARFMWLPVRTPGASQPGMIGARRVA